MPDPVLDELRIPAISLTVEELDERRQQISRGELPSDWMDRYRKALADNVFGFDHKTDNSGAIRNRTKQTIVTTHWIQIAPHVSA